METVKEPKHISLAIGCNGGKNLHAEFFINEKNRMICGHCKEDMTSEMEDLYEKIDEYLDNVK